MGGSQRPHEPPPPYSVSDIEEENRSRQSQRAPDVNFIEEPPDYSTAMIRDISPDSCANIS